MDRNDCFREYWEKHPEEEKLWMEVKPFIIGYEYGIQSNEFLESLKMFSSDNPEALYYTHDYYIVNKHISEAIECINKLKELYPKYNEDWDSQIRWIDFSQIEIMKIDINGKIEGMLEFRRHFRREQAWQE